MPAVKTAPATLIESRIYLIRGQKVLLDRDLARLYQVKPIALRQQVRRNPKRFPSDLLFELNDEEIDILLSQNVIPSRRALGGSRPMAFTEQGVATLSSVLTSERAIEVNIAIMRTFVRLRRLLATPRESEAVTGAQLLLERKFEVENFLAGTSIAQTIQINLVAWFGLGFKVEKSASRVARG